VLCSDKKNGTCKQMPFFRGAKRDRTVDLLTASQLIKTLK